MSISENGDKKTRKPKREFSFGEYVDRLSVQDWQILIDLYFCRCMTLTAVTELYYEYRGTDHPKRNARLRMTWMYQGGILERSQMDPDEIAKNPKQRSKGVRTETWYFLSQRGFRLVEEKLKLEDGYKLSKNELDLARARKEHLWAVAKVYLDLKYQLIPPSAKQFYDWDWYPSLTVYGHNNMTEVRPDAVLRLDNQIYYIELDLSSEPVRRSPFRKGDTFQVSISNKLERYKAVLHHSDVSEEQKNGFIAFIVPDAIYKSRLKNIRFAAKSVFTANFPTTVLIGRTIEDIMAERAQRASATAGEE